MTIKEIIIYPIKGLRGINLSECKVYETGLEYDRKYMLADIDGNLISQRTHPILSLLQPKRVDTSWEITYNDHKIVISDHEISSVKFEVEVWGTRINSYEVSKLHSEWFSDILKMECRLVVMPNATTRIKEFSKPPYKTHVSFADGYPILILGTKSIEYLNSKLSKSLKANRFRPNIIIETNSPHEEDTWQDIQVGENVQIRNIKPCIRCQVITIDQETAQKGKEPLTTLAKYRKFDNGICFGSNAITLKEGSIKIGDNVSLMK